MWFKSKDEQTMKEREKRHNLIKTITVGPRYFSREKSKIGFEITVSSSETPRGS